MTNEIRKIWVALGIIASSMSVISFVQKLFGIGIVPIMSMGITYYRKMLYPGFEIIGKILHIPIPNWYKDAFVLSFIFSIILARIDIMSFADEIRRPEAWSHLEDGRRPPPLIFVMVYKYAVATILSVTLIGIIIPVFQFVKYLSIRDKIRMAKDELKVFLTVAPKETGATWRNSWLLVGVLPIYDKCRLYTIYLIGIMVIAIAFYAVNSALWT